LIIEANKNADQIWWNSDDFTIDSYGNGLKTYVVKPPFLKMPKSPMTHFLRCTGKKSDGKDEEEVKFDSDVHGPTKTIEFGGADPLETPMIQSGIGGNAQGGDDVVEIPQEKEEAKFKESSFPLGPNKTAEEDIVEEIHVGESKPYSEDDMYGECEEDNHWYEDHGDDDAVALMQEQLEATHKRERIRIMQDEVILDHVCEAWLEVGSFVCQESDFM
jgi:hypothetical protein